MTTLSFLLSTFSRSNFYRPLLITGLLLASSFTLAALPHTQNASILQHAPWTESLKPVGTARMRYLMWNIYDATLLAPNGQWQQAQPFGLRLTYLRNLDGKAIAKRSIVEIRQQGFTNESQLAQWEAALKALIPNVRKGDELFGLKLANGHTQFFHDQTYLGSVADPEFSQWFFNIWLGDKTSEPQLRQQLLGLQG